MIKFIVVWTVINSFMVPCASNPSSGYDEYGQYWENGVSSLEICYDTKVLEMSKEFNHHAQATYFLDKAREECGNCKDFKLLRGDGIELEWPEKGE